VSGTFNGGISGIKINFKIRPKGDVGIYMGNGSDGDYLESSVVASVNPIGSYVYEIVETDDGSLYESRIAQNSDNAGDYDATFVTVVGSSPDWGTPFNTGSTDKDRFTFEEI